MTLWVFGDSFAKYNDHQNIWMNQVANKTRQELICLGDDGTSPDYTYYKFNEIRHQILDNDIIIIALTDINRRWQSSSLLTAYR